MLRSKTLIATPPGETIKEQLNMLGMRQKEFAARMGMSEKHISRLIGGAVQLTLETAQKLELVLGVPAEFWNKLELIYRDKILKVQQENALDADAEIAKKFPYRDMAESGFIATASNLYDRVINLRKFFGVAELSLLKNRSITKIACRRLAITEKSDLALLAWTQALRLKAREIETAPINIQRLIEVIPEIRKMTTLSPDDFGPKLREKLAACGVALVFLPHLKGSFLQGASFLDGRKIVVGLTARGRDADKFWFSLFHELAHIRLGHVNVIEGTSENEEAEADNWARDNLIEPDSLAEFKAGGDYSERSIRLFAERQGVAPGIVVGRLQWDRLIGFNNFNSLKEKYVITP